MAKTQPLKLLLITFDVLLCSYLCQMLLVYVSRFTGRSSFWGCCAAPPPPKPKKEKKVKKEKEKKEKKPKKEKKTKTDSKLDDRHSLPDGFQCNGGEEVSQDAVRGDDADRCAQQGQPLNHLSRYCLHCPVRAPGP